MRVTVLNILRINGLDSRRYSQRLNVYLFFVRERYPNVVLWHGWSEHGHGVMDVVPRVFKRPKALWASTLDTQ